LSEGDYLASAILQYAAWRDNLLFKELQPETRNQPHNFPVGMIL
jgi:hypothetical protein